jgi:hypothetical protein
MSFLVFDAIADTKIRKHEPDGLTMDADTGLIFLDKDQHFLDNRWGDLCVGIPPKRVGIVEWDSLEQAEAFYKSKAYNDLAPQRDKAQKVIRRYAVEVMN